MKHSFIISIAYIVTINQVPVQTRDGLKYSHEIDNFKDYQQSKNDGRLEIFRIDSLRKILCNTKP